MEIDSISPRTPTSGPDMIEDLHLKIVHGDAVTEKGSTFQVQMMNIARRSAFAR